MFDPCSQVVLPQDLMKSRRRGIQGLTFQIAMKFGEHLGSSAARDTCQISERYDHYTIQSRGFEASRNLCTGRHSCFFSTSIESVYKKWEYWCNM